MASLGSFGKVKEQEVVDETTFDYFGSTIHLNPLSFNELEFVDLMESVSQVDETDPRAATLIKDMLKLLLAPEDGLYAGKGFDTFWRLAKVNRQGIEDLMAVYTVLMEAQTNRPTRKPSDSSAGLQAVPEKSEAVFSSVVEAPGRPDLQAMREAAAADRRRVALAAVAG